MKLATHLIICRVGLILIGTALCAGCSSESRKVKDRYVPATELARTALEAVLVDWQAGNEPGPIERLAVGVRVVDKQRKKGQTLDEFEILGEAPSEAARCFAVHLKLSGPAAEEKVRFVILGINPLWVFRQEDFESLSQWSCGKLNEEPAKPPPDSAEPDDGPHDSVGNPAGEASTAAIPTDDAAAQSGESGPRQSE